MTECLADAYEGTVVFASMNRGIYLVLGPVTSADNGGILIRLGVPCLKKD